MKAKRVNGRFPSHDDRGRAMYYLTMLCNLLCAACANRENGSLAHNKPTDQPALQRWWLMYAHANCNRWSEKCEHCGAIVPGVPDAPLATP